MVIRRGGSFLGGWVISVMVPPVGRLEHRPGSARGAVGARRYGPQSVGLPRAKEEPAEPGDSLHPKQGLRRSCAYEAAAFRGLSQGELAAQAAASSPVPLRSAAGLPGYKAQGSLRTWRATSDTARPSSRVSVGWARHPGGHPRSSAGRAALEDPIRSGTAGIAGCSRRGRGSSGRHRGRPRGFHGCTVGRPITNRPNRVNGCHVRPSGEGSRTTSPVRRIRRQEPIAGDVVRGNSARQPLAICVCYRICNNCHKRVRPTVGKSQAHLRPFHA
jgi:hypothetical protein